MLHLSITYESNSILAVYRLHKSPYYGDQNRYHDCTSGRFRIFSERTYFREYELRVPWLGMTAKYPQIMP